MTSGARQKDEDWNPEDNGGFAIHGMLFAFSLSSVAEVLTLCCWIDTDKEGVVVDPLAALEKTTEAKNHMENVQRPRIESLQTFSDRYNADPYSLSLKTRKRFREEKKIEQKKKQSDDSLKGRYGLPASLKLLEEDKTSLEEAKLEWEKAKEDYQLRESKRIKTSTNITSISSRIPSRNSTKPEANALGSLRTRILQNTAKRSASTSKS